MADVRSLLREQRQSRRITHPHASYTSDGKLLCNLCEIRIKAESAWQGHLHSTQHTLRVSKSNEASAPRIDITLSKKRKASDVESPTSEDRKRVRPTPSDVEPQAPIRNAVDRIASEQALSAPEVTGTETEAVDAAELEAFERQLASIEASMPKDNALASAVTISAAPMTAEQVAAQAREEQSTQRGRRDAEVEAEREDAANLLDDELEQMDNLETRIQKLRDRRDALRKEESAKTIVAADQADREHGIENGLHVPEVGNEAEDENDDEEEVDAWDFTGR